MTSQRLLEGVQHKLMLKLLEFDYDIQYNRGQDNKVADALSRKDSLLQTSDQCNATSEAIPSWITDIEVSYAHDPKCCKLLQQLSVQADSKPNYTLQAGILHYKGRIYVGEATELRSKILQSFHASVFGGPFWQKSNIS